MFITRKSLVVHEFPTRVCCGGVLWVSVPSGMVGCGSVWLLHVSLCVYCISRLRFSDIGGMAEVDEQRVCIKFGVRLGKTGSETFEMLKQAFGDSCMRRSRTFEWFGRFKNGRTSTVNDDRSGRLSETRNGRRPWRDRWLRLLRSRWGDSYYTYRGKALIYIIFVNSDTVLT